MKERKHKFKRTPPLSLTSTTNFIEFKTFYLKDTSVWIKCQRLLYVIPLKTGFILQKSTINVF